MKKFLLSAFAMLLALTAGAQNFTVEKSPNPLGVQTQAFGAFKAPAKANLAANQRLVGYFDTDDCDNYGDFLASQGDVGSLVTYLGMSTNEDDAYTLVRVWTA